uniref:Uncharacterized protein n=1 Tax=Anguilla anguilla TaxID=7936 RepID=A0A0E9SJI5_ANGAN
MNVLKFHSNDKYMNITR